MRYTAALLAAFMLLLSSTSGMLSVGAMNSSVKKSQCPYAMGKMACSKMPRHDQKKPCNKGGNCPMMLSCSICGFFIAEPITVAQPLFHQIAKPVTPYIIGKLSNYNPSGWKPPKFNC